MQYTKSLKLYHYGAVNVRSVLNWMYQSLPTAPKVVFVTGCSAGSYASLLWSTDIMKHYESIAAPTQVVQFGDSGMGYYSKSGPISAGMESIGYFTRARIVSSKS